MDPPEQEFTVLTWNVWNNLEVDPQLRATLLAEEIERLQPCVCLLQEMTETMQSHLNPRFEVTA